MEVPYQLFLVFAIAWASYLIAETARIAAESNAACENFDDLDSDALEKQCNGGVGGGVFCMIGCLAALIAGGMALMQKPKLRLYAFIASLMCYSLGRSSELGGLSAAECDTQNDDDIDDNKCSGYGAACAFFLFAALASAASIVTLMISYEERTYYSAVSFIFLGLYAVGELATLAVTADDSCTADDDDLIPDETIDANESRCSGYGFGTFMMSMCFVVGVAMAVYTFIKKDTSRELMGWYVWVALYFVGLASKNGAEAQVYCEYLDDEDYQEAYCNGYGAATVFFMFGLLPVAGGIFFLIRPNIKLQQVLFFAVWIFYYIAYSAAAGGYGNGNCIQLDDLPKAASDYQEDELDAKCNGYAGATVFGMVSFTLMLGAAILSWTKFPALESSSQQPSENAGAADAAPAPQKFDAGTASAPGADV